MSNIYFNDVLLPSFVTVTNIGIQALPDLENNLVSVGKLTGLYDMGTKRGGKKIAIDFIIKNNSLNTMANAEALAEWLKGNDFRASKLVLPEFPNSHYIAKVNNNVDIDDLIKIGKGTIEFVLLNPNRIDTTPIVITPTENAFSFNYTGTTETIPIIEFTVKANVNTITMYFLTPQMPSAKNLRVVGNFVTGDKIEINCKTRKITLNSVINMPILTLDSTFVKMQKGICQFDNNSFNYADVKITYNNEYL